ncbi:hypothetical protein [Nitrosospira briensis]|uniref:hypothetical protein n=1 Tax=Nitrosospira briensis TaxID=35799 RepID=UPI00046A3293|nr:hypothetical protein [Nitrosospira briensis]
MDRSYALPAKYYRDPAETLEARQLDRLGCKLCTKHAKVLGRSMCMDERNKLQAGVPTVGHRCRWFDERR